MATSDWSRVHGQYKSSWGEHRVQTFDGKLAMVDLSQPDPKAAATFMIPADESGLASKVVAAGDPYFLDETIEFELDKQNNVVSLNLPGYTGTLAR